MARAQESVNNAFADRLFTQQAIAQSGARQDWTESTKTLLSGHPTASKQLAKMVDNIHAKVVRVELDDLKLHEA